MESMRCVSRPGATPNDWGRRLELRPAAVLATAARPQPNRRSDCDERRDWSLVARGQRVTYKGYYALFVGWAGAGSVPWLVTCGKRLRPPTAGQIAEFDRLCAAFDRVHATGTDSATGTANATGAN